MARVTNKKRAQVNKQLWERANNSHRQRWQTLSQKGFDFYLNEQLSKREIDSLEGQAGYWKKYYNTEGGKGDPEHFIESVKKWMI